MGRDFYDTVTLLTHRDNSDFPPEGAPIQDEVAGGSAEASDGSTFETWLRKAARFPSDVLRVTLPEPGQVVAEKYRIERQLGRGGMGAVYLATHLVSGKQVALKWMLRPVTDAGAAQRFAREARAAGRIDHPNVVDIYDIGQDGPAAFLVMELLRGESLRARLGRHALAPDAAVSLLVPAMRGVAAAHAAGVIHRDLKPDNIFLCRARDGAEREAKVLDFGLSSISAPDHESLTLTREGTVLGTPSYMSPEQLHSLKDVDARTDVYAFGVILYECLTGRVPFLADSYNALVLAIANTSPRSPRELRPAIPEALEQVLLRAMHKDRAQRFQSVHELIAAVMPFTAGTVAAGDDASMPAAPRPRWLIATAALAVCILVAWWFWPAADGRAPGPALAAEHAPAVHHALAVAPQPAPARPQPSSADTPAAATSAAPQVAIPAASHVAVQGKDHEHAPKPEARIPTPATTPPPSKADPAHFRAGPIVVDDL